MCGPQPEIRLSELDLSEVNEFLRFLFEDVAGRPKPLLLRETAAVVRYLGLLALKGLPQTVLAKGLKAIEQYEKTDAYKENRDARRVLEQMASAIWGDLLRFGQIEPCSPGQAFQFLCRHAGTYLAGHPLLPLALKLVQELKVAPKKPGEPEPFAPPLMMSRSRSGHGTGNPRLQDDLSERIYVAFHALKRTSVKSAKNRIAEALVTVSASGRRKDFMWTYESVHERAKEYEARHRKEYQKAHGRTPSDEWTKGWRNSLVEAWILVFRSSRQK